MRIKEMTEAYIAYRRSIGEKYKTGATMLRCFAKHMGETTDSMEISVDTCTAFLYGQEMNVTPSWFLRYSALKWMFDWAVVRGYMCSVPLPEEKPKALEHMRPYIYTKTELRALFAAALTYQKNRSKTPPECIQMMLKLTYCLGLRIHETAALRIKDIDMEGRYALVRESKFYKTRVLPFNGTVAGMLARFLAWRKDEGYECEADSPLFPDKNGQPIDVDTVRRSFQRIRDVAGIVRNDGSQYQPRLHDLRHTFAVHRLTSWYREGKDVQRLICHLSTYLGHDKVSHTSVYLTMTDSLLREANKRFESYSHERKT